MPYPYKKLMIILLACSWFICQCNPERDNPLDPESPYYRQQGYLTGVVHSIYSENSRLPDIAISCVELNLQTRTNANGVFTFPPLPQGNYLLIAAHSDFEPDTLNVIVVAGDTNQVSFSLDGLPVFNNLKVYSSFVDHWFPGSVYQLHCEARVSDVDGPTDLDSVFIEIPEFSLEYELTFNFNTERFERVIVQDELSDLTIHQMLGFPIYFRAVDKLKNDRQSLPLYVARIIEETPVPESPEYFEEVGTQPRVSWLSPDYSYPVTYDVEIYYLFNNISSLLWKLGQISPESSSVQVDDPLPDGDYYWSIAVVDQQGNSGRSKEARFIVNSGQLTKSNHQ